MNIYQGINRDIKVKMYLITILLSYLILSPLDVNLSLKNKILTILEEIDCPEIKEWSEMIKKFIDILQKYRDEDLYPFTHASFKIFDQILAFPLHRNPHLTDYRLDIGTFSAILRYSRGSLVISAVAEWVLWNKDNFLNCSVILTLFQRWGISPNFSCYSEGDGWKNHEGQIISLFLEERIENIDSSLSSHYYLGDSISSSVIKLNSPTDNYEIPVITPRRNYEKVIIMGLGLTNPKLRELCKFAHNCFLCVPFIYFLEEKENPKKTEFLLNKPISTLGQIRRKLFQSLFMYKRDVEITCSTIHIIKAPEPFEGFRKNQGHKYCVLILKKEGKIVPILLKTEDEIDFQTLVEVEIICRYPKKVPSFPLPGEDGWDEDLNPVDKSYFLKL